MPKGSPDGTRVLLFRACFDAPPVNGIFVTDTAGSYRTKITDGFGPDWNPADIRGPRINSVGNVIHAGVSPAVSPGSLADIYGTNMAVAAGAALPGANLPVRLGGVQVLVNGTSNSMPAPLIYVSDKQIIFQAPYETDLGIASVIVVSNHSPSAAAPMNVQQSAPSILTYGANRAMAINEDNTLNAAGNGARPGSVLVAYLIGSGPLDNPLQPVVAATVAAVPRNARNECFSRRRNRRRRIRRDGARLRWADADKLRHT